MDNGLVGLRFEGEAPLELCSKFMRKTFAALVDQEQITFDRLLYPYADTLLLCGENADGHFFGTHALMYGIKSETLAKAVFSACADISTGENMLDLLSPHAERLECSYSAVREFLDISAGREENCEYIGDFAALLGGIIRPWNIREASRRLCSFCEQAARTDGVKLRGIHGGSVCADVDPDAAETLIRLYTAKTGGNAVR